MIKNYLIKMINFYQKNLSFLKPNCCRFYPTCSEYSKHAIQVFGLTKGFFLSIFRIIRCNPFCKGGIDLIPKTANLKVKKKD